MRDITRNGSNSENRVLTLKCKLKCYEKPMKDPLGVSPSKGNQGTTRGKEKFLLTSVGIEPTTSGLDLQYIKCVCSKYFNSNDRFCHPFTHFILQNLFSIFYIPETGKMYPCQEEPCFIGDSRINPLPHTPIPSRHNVCIIKRLQQYFIWLLPVFKRTE